MSAAFALEFVFGVDTLGVVRALALARRRFGTGFSSSSSTAF